MTDERTVDEFSDLKELMLDAEDLAARPSGYDPQRRRRRRRGWLITGLVLLLIVGSVGGYTAWALNAPVSVPASVSQVPAVPAAAPAAIAMPTEGSMAVTVSGADEYLGSKGGMLATSGGDDRRPIASISKLITAMVVLNAKPLKDANDPGRTITFSKANHDLYDQYYLQGATIAPMPTGSTMSERDAISTMLIASAANYADAVSTWAFGSQSGYVGAARKWLKDNGLNNTTIVEPTGMSARNTSTPSDLIKLGQLAHANPAIAAIVATPSMDVPGAGRLTTTNDLLGKDGVNGMKTGNLGEGTHNLLYTASLNVGNGKTVDVTGVMLGGQTRGTVDDAVSRLLDSIKGGFRTIPLAQRGQEIGSYSTPWGSSAKLIVGDDASIFTWSDTPITVKMDVKTPKTYQSGEKVGTITWKSGPNTTTVPVQVDGTITPPTDWWRLTHPSELGG